MDRPRILHCLGEYLPVSQNWIYPQISGIADVEGAVYCERTLNLGQFGLPHRQMFCRSAESSPLRTSSFLPVRLAGKAIDRFRGVAAPGWADWRARQWRPSLLHAHFGMLGWASLRLREALGAPLITSFYGYDAWSEPEADPVWRRRIGELFVKGDVFLVEGPAFRERLLSLGCAPEKVRVQRLGVTVDGIAFRARGAARPLKIVMVGRFVEKKGLIDGLRACAQAVDGGLDLSVTIIGDAPATDLTGQRIKAELVELSAGPQLSGRVRFAGFLPQADTHALMALHDVFICPSKHASNGDAEGGYPVILAEAMAMGLVCIGSRHCDIPEVIVDGKTGFLFEEGRMDQLVEILGSVAARSPSIGTAGRRHIEQNFNVASQLTTLAETYAECMRNGRHANCSA